MTLINVLEARDRVKRLIIDPLTERGEPPRGFSISALAEDYLDALGSYPAEVLAKAATIVRRTWERNTWPLPSTFRRACEALMVDKPPSSSAAELDLTQRSVRAWDYVERRLAAGTGELGLRRLKERGAMDLRDWLFRSACGQLRAGRDIHISDADVNAHIADGEAWCLENWGPEASAPAARTGNLGTTANAMVDRARATANEEQAETEEMDQ